MFYVYLLQSKKDKSIYIGYSNNLKERFVKHNNGQVPYTNKHKPYRIVYYEAYIARKDAKRRERLLKENGGQRDFLKENIKNSLE